MQYYIVSLYYFDEAHSWQTVAAPNPADAVSRCLLTYDYMARRLESPHPKDENLYPYTLRVKRSPEQCPYPKVKDPDCKEEEMKINWAEETVKEMLDLLKDRGGFDGWWGDIDAATQQEIIDELVKIQQKYGQSA